MFEIDIISYIKFNNMLIINYITCKL